MPQINFLLFVGCLFLVIMFKSSSGLAAAYGIAVTGTMIATALMAFVVIWKGWGWKPYAAVALMAPFVIVEAVFLSANLTKVDEGGWLPLLLAAGRLRDHGHLAQRVGYPFPEDSQAGNAAR